jgi:hypothetical protein
MIHLDFAGPFTRLVTTQKEAQRYADRSGTARTIVRTHPLSAAAQCGMRFGILDDDDIQAAKDAGQTVLIVERIEPKGGNHD